MLRSPLSVPSGMLFSQSHKPQLQLSSIPAKSESAAAARSVRQRRSSSNRCRNSSCGRSPCFMMQPPETPPLHLHRSPHHMLPHPPLVSSARSSSCVAVWVLHREPRPSRLLHKRRTPMGRQLCGSHASMRQQRSNQMLVRSCPRRCQRVHSSALQQDRLTDRG